VKVRELGIAGSWEFLPTVHRDDRGYFLETFVADTIEEATGRSFAVAQVNRSQSSAGVLRGIHFAALPPSQAKYVSCTQGRIFDVVVDLRIGSPTFGNWEGVILDADEGRSVFISEGLGHGFLALEEQSTVVYLCSAAFAPGREHGVHPFDVELGIEWPAPRGGCMMSDKDASAPSLREVVANGWLAAYPDVEFFVGHRADGPRR
jgi:dTDP-4-dehydrorhamnose 3,5-epimerase